MSKNLQVKMLEQKIESMESHVNMLRSSHLNTLIDVQVVLEDGDIDEALNIVRAITAAGGRER